MDIFFVVGVVDSPCDSKSFKNDDFTVKLMGGDDDDDDEVAAAAAAVDEK